MELDCADKRAFLLVLLLRQPDYYTQLVQSVKYLLVSLGTRVGYSRRRSESLVFMCLPSHQYLSPRSKKKPRFARWGALKLAPTR